MSIVANYSHALDYLKGWPSESALDYAAKLSGDNAFPPYGGRVVHVNAAGAFQLGAKGSQMPIFLKEGVNELDVTNASVAGPHAWFAFGPTGAMNGLVATGGYELQTTEYDTTEVSWAVNDILHAPTENQINVSDKSVAGKLFKKKAWPGGANAALVPYTDAICGIVSRPLGQNSNRVPALSFWPVFFIGTEGNS